MPGNAPTLNFVPFSAAPSGREAIDVPGLVERCMGDPSLASQLLQLFQQRVPAAVEQIELQLSRGDLTRAAGLTHGLKGEAANMGATHVHRAASDLEKLLKSGCVAEASASMDSLRAAVHGFLHALPSALSCLVGDEQAASSM